VINGATHFVVDSRDVENVVHRRVFDAERAEAAHQWAKSEVKRWGRGRVSMRMAAMNDDGYLIEE
jgi:hypothetical protein